MAMAKYRGVDLKISKFPYKHEHGWDQYQITGTYKGQEIKAFTYDKDVYLWLNNDYAPDKHKRAKQHAYQRIVDTYKEFHQKKKAAAKKD